MGIINKVTGFDPQVETVRQLNRLNKTQAKSAAAASAAGPDYVRQLEERVAALEARVQWCIDVIQKQAQGQ